ncbi:La like protein [Termitomyces sp. J132]|nr:La like protein [Termitomyces sp. J132]
MFPKVEFYFGDANLPFDKFMWTLYTKDPDHWVPIETVSSFKRMREYSARGVDWVVAALRTSTFLEVDAEGKRVRRRTEVQKPKGQYERSVYAKGFPDEEPTLQKRLEAFFGKYGKTNAVRMRRTEDKKFKNSVFAEFADFATVDVFLKADPKPTFEGKELLIMTKDAYCEMKIKEKGLTGKSANHRREIMSTGRGFNAFREMARANAQNKDGASASAPAEKKDVYLEFMGTKLLIHQDEEGVGSVKPEDVPFVRGATLKFEGCGGDVSWSDIKNPIKEKFEGRVPFIKYMRGEDSGLVGFHKALTEDEIQIVKDTIKTLNSKEVSWSVPDETTEKAFQIERAQSSARSALESTFGGSSGRGRGRGRGRGGARGRGGRGGRDGGGRGRGGRAAGGRGREGTDKDGKAKEPGSEEVGEKRKRAVEPDGGPDVGIRGKQAPPVLQSAAKKAKTEGDATS